MPVKFIRKMVIGEGITGPPNGVPRKCEARALHPSDSEWCRGRLVFFGVVGLVGIEPTTNAL